MTTTTRILPGEIPQLPRVKINHLMGMFDNLGIVSVKDFATGDGVTDDSTGVQAFHDVILGGNGPGFIPSSTYKISSSITGPNSAVNGLTLMGGQINGSIFKQDNAIVFDYPEKDLTVAKSSFNSFEKLRFIADTTGKLIFQFGTSDFNTWKDCQFNGGTSAGVAMRFNGQIALATRIVDCWFFQFNNYAIELIAQHITDFQLRGVRLEGSSIRDQTGGILVNSSELGHSTNPQNTRLSSIIIENSRTERLGNWGINFEQVWGGVIRGGHFGLDSVFFGHRTTQCVAENLTFNSLTPGIIDSGYANRISGTIVNAAGLRPIYNHGYNSILKHADNFKISGLDGWTGSAGNDSTRFYNSSHAPEGVSPLYCTNNATLSRSVELEANTYYVVRCALGTEINTTAKTQGGQITITENAGSVLKFDSGNLLTTDLQYGMVAYETWVFKTGATTTYDMVLASKNNEPIYFYLFDIAKNLLQENADMEGAFDGSNNPGAAHTTVGNITSSKNTTNNRFGTNCWQIDCLAITTGTSEVRVNIPGLIDGRKYEVSYWITDLVPGDGPSEILCGNGAIAQVGGGQSNAKYYDGHATPIKITYQYEKTPGSNDDVIPFRRSGAFTDVRAQSLCIEHISVVEADLLEDRASALSGAGAIPLTDRMCHYTSTGAAQALTLADGKEGQRLTIIHISDGGDGDLTATSMSGWLNINFIDVGDTADLLFTNGAWHFIGGTATLRQAINIMANIEANATVEGDITII